MLIKRFQQHTDPNFPNGPGKGVCLTMSCWYLIHAAKGDFDYWDWFSEHAAEIYRQGNQTVHPSHYFDDIYKVGTLKLTEQLTIWGGHRLPVNLLQGARGPWRLAVMENEPFKLAHAIACYMGLKIRVLDVTDGEFEFDSRDACLTWLHQQMALPRVKCFGPGLLSYADAFPKLTVYGFQKKVSA